MKKPMTMKAYEKSKADAKADKTAAKKRGEPVAKWEGSKADRKADKAAVKKINKGCK